jgi:hypothetical protein
VIQGPGAIDELPALVQVRDAGERVRWSSSTRSNREIGREVGLW